MLFRTILSLLLLSTSPLLQAKLYKWVDEEGNTHYSDKIPPKQQKKAHKKLDDQGMVIESRGAAKSAAQIAREKELERLRTEQNIILEKQRAADRVLLRTFRSEDDLILTRDGKMATIDQQIRVSRDNIKRLKQHLTQKQSYAAKLERQGKKVSQKLEKDIENTSDQIQAIYSSIIKKEKNKEIIQKKFDSDLERFRQLKKMQHKNLEKLDQIGSQKAIQTNLVETTVSCDSTAQCNRLWKKARTYGLSHANTRIQTDSKKLLISAPATRDNEYSITVSRIQTSPKEPEIIFFDIQCKNNEAGNNLCNSEQIRTIRKGFSKIMND